MAKDENVLKKQKMIVGISGASGTWYAARLLTLLRELNIETHLVVSKAAQMTRALETDLSQADLVALADYHYPIDDFSAGRKPRDSDSEDIHDTSSSTGPSTDSTNSVSAPSLVNKP